MGNWTWKSFGTAFSAIGTWIQGFFTVLRAIVVDALVVGAIALVVAVAWREIMRPDTVIEEIVLPKPLLDLGYSGQVAAMRLVDAVNELNEEARRLSDLDQKTSLVPSSRQFEFVEPQSGLSLRAVSSAIDSLFPGRRTHVAGEFVCTTKTCDIGDLQLRMRVFNGAVLEVATAGRVGAIGGTEDEIEQYFRRSAVELLKVLDPIVVAERLAASALSEPYDAEFGDQTPVREEAIRLSKSLVRRGHEDDARAAALLGQIYSLAGDRHEAERWFARVVTIATPEETPLIATADYNWGEMLGGAPGGKAEAKAKWENAAKLFAASARRGQLGSSYLIWQGLALEELGRLDEAQAVYERWIIAEPDNSGARFQLAYLLSGRAKKSNDGDAMEEAIAAFNSVLDIDPVHYRAYNEIAVLLAKLNRPVDALRYFAMAATLSETDEIVASNLRSAKATAVVVDRKGACALVPANVTGQSSVQEKLAMLLADDCPP